MLALSRRAALAKGGAALAIAGAAATGGAQAQAPTRRVEVFGHRGACAWFPEHTLASYARAVADGADYVEPDLVPTKDGALVARHEPDITETTDVSAHPEFAGRRTTKVIDGESFTGWFTTDFTLAELKTLRCRERLPSVRPQSAAYDGAFQIVTFEEYLDFIAAESAARGRLIGLVPEIKHSTWFASQGLPMEDRFLSILNSHAYARRAPVEIQSFETANLHALRRRIGRPANVRLMQLTGEPGQLPADVAAAGGRQTWAEITSAAGLREVATYADVIAPNDRLIIPTDAAGRLSAPTPLVADAHAAGLLVRTWTLRPENQFLAVDFRNAAGPNARNPAGSIAEMQRYIAAGVDGFFTDDPGLGRQAVAAAARA